ncbi:acyl-CoA dehydrogenase family protein [Acidianus sp. HS-5]|uniref:acyl-CoA dehydrogenase family protein n=1 Tax=Acidianus sp. HS-5 TaxID=2886040 RepID=UPI001F2AB3B1|nr:acyl-CoA dehydrogenase family protein [Acidianus sp. HS-5]BDC17608.1 acyl-CoA dehydrogenase [Acidianus sp. HS-5]
MVFPFNSIEEFKVNITQDHEIFRNAIREFCDREVSPLVEKGEREKDIPQELKIKAREIGLYGLDVPTEYGGQGGDYLYNIIASEEISRVWSSFATFFLINWMFTHAILTFGNEEQKKNYVTEVAKGEKIAAFANTEPNAGTDVAGIQTTAKKVNDHFVINGKKIFITNGDIADYYLVTARTSAGNPRWKGISMFIIEKDNVKVEGRIGTTGLKASHTAEISFNEAKVPAENLLGEEGMGFKYAVSSFDYARTLVSAQAVGIGQAALEKMIEYSIQRNSFGQKIASFQNVQQHISESLADLYTSRLITYWAGNLKGEDYVVVASLAKFFSTEAVERIVLRAMRVFGGYGVAEATGLERMLRDLQILKTYEGTNDIQRLSAAKFLIRKKLGVEI